MHEKQSNSKSNVTNEKPKSSCEDALRNMLGYFGTPAVKLALGKQFTQEHADIIKQAREALSEYP